MSEEPGPTPEEVAAAARLAHFKTATRERVVSHMHGVGASIINAYPIAEVMSWPIQRAEAMAIIALGETAALALTSEQTIGVAPFLVDMCDGHYGAEADDAVRAQRLWDKAVLVKGKSDVWAALSAFLCGLRARMDDQVAAATSEIALFEIESNVQTELSAFRNQYGV
ncbi:hypothetical protein JP75_06660 [Devosia riboflavina]|uniref:Uncharacterized protein n=1 Tax=Devosia riboflavina TaxID=46914 RepID=A0A087M4D8_9HYPH|nr:hypothetical protein [Devosia riboflavina]KFL31741.1 hypothetical protein JP75_06660 [Devosia riboflavina]